MGTHKRNGNEIMWSIYEIPEILIEGSEVDRLLQRFPNARQAGGNYIFVASLPNAVDPIIVENVEDVDTMTVLALHLISDDRTKAIHLSKALCSELNKAALWIQWVEAYALEDQETLDAIRAGLNEI